MPRLFTALELPEPLRLHLSLIRAPINGAKWVEADNMHITLRFAGDIDERTADDFADRLHDIRAEPLPITVAGVGAFAGREARVLWAGVDGGVALEELYRANERAARAVGLEADPRPFKPHVTLARARGVRPRAAARFLQENGALRLMPFVASRFVLLSARPGSGGPPYALEEAYPLAPALSLGAG
ncbi:MAG TPA: RNA 2',3'-cyclic phosphodiesterase [Hyphomicrobiaceae bacterium]|nr:RNA 2',3'-cyclic phosphodiesterase [Hyphomicrobiaceae bacterium]